MKTMLVKPCIHRIFIALGLAAAGAMSAPGHAQSAAAADAPPAAESATLDAIVVTAQRRREDAQQVPITVQAFDAQAIRDLEIRSSTDIGQVTPNVQIALPSGAGAQPVITIRGIGLNDFNSNNSGPNGIYMDEVYLSAAGAQTFSVFDLDRIEVLKGPQGTLYGRNTSGGAINFISAKPSADTTAFFTASYSSYATFREEGAIGGRIADGINGRVSFVKENSGGYFHNTLTAKNENGSNDYAVRAQVSYAPRPDLKVLFNIHGGELVNRPTEYRHVGTLNPANGQLCSVGDAFAGHCVDAFGYGTPGGFYSGAFNRQLDLSVADLGGSVRAEYTPGSITFTSITAFEQNNKFHPEDTDASPNRLLEINYGVLSDTLTQEFRAAQSGDGWNWVAGVYGLHERLWQNQPVEAFVDFDNFFGAGAGDGLAQVAFDDNRQVTKSYAAFGQADYALSARWKATLGARFTDESKSFQTVASGKYQSTGIDAFGPLTPLWSYDLSTRGSRFSGKAAIDYQAAETISVYASIASGFKSAGFNGGFLSANPVEARRQLGPVNPENVLAYEVGVKSLLLDRRLQANIALFYNDYRDMQVFNQIPPVIAGGFDLEILTNAPKTHTEGVDAQLVAKPTPNLKTTLNLGLLRTRIDEWNTASGTGSTVDYTGNRLPLAPSASLEAMIDYRIVLANGVINLFADSSYRSKQFFDVSNDPYITQAGYWLVNLKGGYLFGQGRYELAGFVRNLTNRQYLTDAINLSNPFGLVQDVVGTPRFVGAEFTYRY